MVSEVSQRTGHLIVFGMTVGMLLGRIVLENRAHFPRFTRNAK
jgi:hypothetical protein